VEEAKGIRCTQIGCDAKARSSGRQSNSSPAGTGGDKDDAISAVDEIAMLSNAVAVQLECAVAEYAERSHYAGETVFLRLHACLRVYVCLCACVKL
jgi:hypothetical protein